MGRMPNPSARSIKQPNFREFLWVVWEGWASRVSGIVSVPFTIAAFWVNPQYARFLFGCLAFVAFLIMTYQIWSRERKRFLELEEELNKDNLKLSKLEFGNARIISTPTGGAYERIFGQVLIRLRSPGVAVHNATGKLLRIWKWSQQQNDWILTEADEALDLLWSGIDQPVCNLGSDQQLDVFCREQNSPHIRIWGQPITLRTERVLENIKRTDIFRFDILVCGDDCSPIYVSLKLRLGDHWDNPIFEPL